METLNLNSAVIDDQVLETLTELQQDKLNHESQVLEAAIDYIIESSYRLKELSNPDPDDMLTLIYHLRAMKKFLLCLLPQETETKPSKLK